MDAGAMQSPGWPPSGPRPRDPQYERPSAENSGDYIDLASVNCRHSLG
jgi:hypothetical protein